MILIIYQQGFEKLLPQIEHIIDINDKQSESVERDDIYPEIYKDRELIIVLGGDGTFLRSSHCNLNVPMFGINPLPERKEGFFMQATIEDFEKKLNNVMQGKYSTADLLRLKVSVDGKRLPELALNDIYIGDKKPYNVFNYDLIIDGKREFQRSSGLIVGTAPGSNAWLKSAGGSVLEMTDKRYQYIARELYEGRLTEKYAMEKGFLEEDDELKIFVKSPAIVVFDSVSQEYPVGREQMITVSKGKPLPYIML